MSEKQKGSNQQQAIHDYLESLLLDIDESNEQLPLQAEPVDTKNIDVSPQHKEPVATPLVVGLDKLVAEIPQVIVETKTEVETDLLIETGVKPQVNVEIPEVAESLIPVWAETRFQCLLFKVSGLSLAVPLVKLNSVIPWDEEITHTPNKTEWYLGLIKHLEYQIKVIDTALLVMPENRHEKIETDREKRLSHILLVDDYQWGLACDSIGEVIWLTQDEVKWRKNKKTRAWLSGTSLEHLCAIMDTQVFAEMLNEPT